MLGPRTEIVSVTHVSNALGTINPVHAIVRTGARENIPCWSTERRPCRIIRWMSRLWTATSTCSPVTRCMVPLASAFCMAKPLCWMHASLPGRRRHDQLVTFEKTIYNKLAL